MSDSLTFELASDEAAIARLRVTAVIATERISRLYEVTIEAVADGAAPDAEELCGHEAALVVMRDGAEVRRIHGLVHRADERFDLESDDRAAYRLVLAPRAHRLTFVRSQQVHLDASVPEIVVEKLGLVGLDEPDACHLSLVSSYAKREFVVQFDETDLDHVQRLTEHLGIAYFFEQAEGCDRMVFADHAERFPKTPGIDGRVRLAPRHDDRGIRTLERDVTAKPASYMVMDYNYRTPNVELFASSELEGGYGGGIVEYGGHFKSEDEGRNLARVRAEEAESERVVFRGTSNVPELTAGHRIEIDGHPKLDGIEFLIVEVRHEAARRADGAESAGYTNTFSAVPIRSGATYRPPRVTPKPKIAGLLTGIVETGERGSVERYARIDENGRYVIRFLYDYATPGTERPSHPVRKAEPTVGPDYGMHFPLRPGVEVVMAFVNGDPDRPIIVGALHNTAVPAHVRTSNSTYNMIKTASGIRMNFRDD